MTDLTIGHGTGLGHAGRPEIDFSAVDRNAPGHRGYVERLQREGCPLNDIPASGPPYLIGLCSRAMQSGKSTLANHLAERHGFTALKFAGPLKAMTRALLLQQGFFPSTVERMVEGDLKESELLPSLSVSHGTLDAMTDALLEATGLDPMEIGNERLNCHVPALHASPRQIYIMLRDTWAPLVTRPLVTPRWIMQSLGTEFGRECLHPNVWVDITCTRAAGLLAAGKSVVIDDMRYANEMAGVRDTGGFAVRVIRPQAIVTNSHSSEGELDEAPMTSITNGFASVDSFHGYIDRDVVPRLDEWRKFDSLNR